MTVFHPGSPAGSAWGNVRRTGAAAAIAVGLIALHSGVALGSGTSGAAASAPKPAKLAQAGGTRAAARTGWAALTAEQQHALRPLAGAWPKLSEAQKRKWIALSRNYPRMTPDDQARLHSRMTEWVALSPQQRTQARLNFAETKDLSADDKKAKWEAYQALPPEEKRKLAAGAHPRTPPTAAAIKPVPPQKLAKVPRASRKSKPPRIDPADTTAAPRVQPLQPVQPAPSVQAERPAQPAPAVPPAQPTTQSTQPGPTAPAGPN